MQIAQNVVASFDYVLTGADGEVIDKSEPGQPLPYLHGAGNIIPGLEAELEGKTVGDELTAVIEPKLAYGERNEQMVQQVPKAAFQGVEDLEVGMRFTAESNAGPVPVVITAVEGDTITVDGNHPLAGQTLTFQVKVTEVREASKEEIEHGHVHNGSCDH
ncbi:MAG: peptidylprolyl isomerase [Gammaproteobacteria bacterium]|nr:peptidylprolyl isomerase [Gammaproteobacteria bacterium]